MNLQWQAITLGNLQCTGEDVINKVFICDSDRLSSWMEKLSEYYVTGGNALNASIRIIPRKTSLSPSSASLSDTFVLISSPLRYAAILLRPTTLSAFVITDKEINGNKEIEKIYARMGLSTLIGIKRI